MAILNISPHIGPVSVISPEGFSPRAISPTGSDMRADIINCHVITYISYIYNICNNKS